MAEQLKEELSTSQHSEFTVSRATDLVHRCWSVLTLAGTTNQEAMKKYAKQYGVPFRAVITNLKRFKALTGQS